MFRIKTDIRQYKCETKDKVEKLIRNWVIRPTDLLYDADGKDWAPIGDHPAFVSLFGMLDEQEKNTPDTVVTMRSPYVDAESDVEPPNGGGGEPVEEVTRISGRPVAEDSEAEDTRSTDLFDQEEIAQSLSASATKPPEAPVGVEPIVNDGEVTMMTERTLDMLKITDEDEDARALERKKADAARDPTVVVAEDLLGEEEEEEEAEITGVRERQNAAEDTDDAEIEDRDDLVEADDDQSPDEEGEEVDEGASDEEDEEITGVRERQASENDDDEEPDEPRDGPKLPTLPEKTVREKVLESGPKLGRHDLPEELFATNEISSPEVLEQLKRLDELAELAEPSEPTKNEPRPTNGEGGEWPDRLEEDSGVDEAWDVVAEDLRTTEEMGADAKAADAPTDEVERDDFDEDEWEDDDEGGEPELIPTAAADFVSDGYRVNLPFPVRPTADDIRLGMPQGRVSKAVKDRSYPLPQPKKLNEIHRRVFDLSPEPPRDQTWVIAAVVVTLVVFVMIVATC